MGKKIYIKTEYDIDWIYYEDGTREKNGYKRRFYCDGVNTTVKTFTFPAGKYWEQCTGPANKYEKEDYERALARLSR